MPRRPNEIEKLVALTRHGLARSARAEEAIRCACIKKNGRRCRRRKLKGHEWCWQHKRMEGS